MALDEENKDQQHPQEKKDQVILDKLLEIRGTPTEEHLAELGRLRIRYTGFPGARSIQRTLDTLLQRWQLTEEQLFERTRQIHDQAQVYKQDTRGERQDDWS